jgi:hypothetical protein
MKRIVMGGEAASADVGLENVMKRIVMGGEAASADVGLENSGNY